MITYMNREKKLILTVAFVFFLICALYALLRGKWEDIHYSAVCGNCLQKASFHVKKYLGITFYKECSLIQPDSNINPSPDSEDKISDGDPNLFEQIHGKQCGHYFLKQGHIGRRTSTFFESGVDADLHYLGGVFYFQRLQGITSVYHLFELTQDKKEAQNSFRIIDALHPVKEKQPRAAQILQMYVDELEGITSLEQWKRTNKEYFKMLQLEIK